MGERGGQSRSCTFASALAFVAVGLSSTPSANALAHVRAQTDATRNLACAVLSVDEVRKITGYPGYNVSSGDPPGQGAGGGSSCQYVAPVFGGEKGPLVSLVFIEGKDWTAQNRGLIKLPETCKREPAPAIGDDAYFEVCSTPRPRRTFPLYVKAGAKDLILQIDIEDPETEMTMRPKVVALAKAAVAKLR